jgi:3-methyladenine DNA glycosylase AlkD
MDLHILKQEIEMAGNASQAKALQRFFKTGKGDYGEGDVFLGIKVPVQRAIAKKYELDLGEIQELLNSKIHEHRLIGLLILIDKYKKSREKKICDFYLANTRNVNNWDLVDLSCHKILGDFLLNNDRNVLYDLARSDNLWEKRISIVSTFAFIKEKDFYDALAIAELLLNDRHDLIHKAVGWVLREIGKKDPTVEEEFLKKHYKKMPRTMLRYAIEKFEDDKRKAYLRGEV